jgi:hypothetical protein
MGQVRRWSSRVTRGAVRGGVEPGRRAHRHHVAGRGGPGVARRRDWAAPTVLVGHGDRIHSAAWSPDGARIVTAAEDATARVWQVADGLVLAGHAGAADGRGVASRRGAGAHRVDRRGRPGVASRRSGRPDRRPGAGAPTGSRTSRGAPTARASSRRSAAPRRRGARTTAATWSCSRATPTRSTTSRGAPTAGGSRPRPTTGRRGCGGPTAQVSVGRARGPPERRRIGGVEPRRPAHPHHHLVRRDGAGVAGRRRG